MHVKQEKIKQALFSKKPLCKNQRNARFTVQETGRHISKARLQMSAKGNRRSMNIIITGESGVLIINSNLALNRKQLALQVDNFRTTVAKDVAIRCNIKVQWVRTGRIYKQIITSRHLNYIKVYHKAMPN